MSGSSPNWPLGYVPTNAEWNALWASKQDVGGILSGSFALSSTGTIQVGANAVQWGLLPSNAGSPTSGGSGHAVGDVITLTGGAKVAISAVSGSVATNYSVTQSGAYTSVPTAALAQTATTGVGTGFSITPFFGPLAANIGTGPLVPGLANLSIGYLAGALMTTATESTLYGNYTGRNITTGISNTGVGHNAMGVETTGSGNTVVGQDAMRNTVGVSSSNAFGSSALRSWVGQFNHAFGVSALQGNEDGVSSTGGINIAIGTFALRGLTATTAANNIAIGNNTASGITTGTDNMLIGHSSGLLITTAANNTIVGNGAGAALVSGFENAFFGWHAGIATTGNSNSFFGFGSGVAVTSGGANSFFGERSGAKVTTGSNNLILGPGVASNTLTTGSGNILIGATSATDAAASGTNDTLKIQGNSATAAISGTGLNSSTPAITIPGSLTTPIVSGVINLTLGTGSAVATNATTGMIFIPSCAGTPSGSVGALGGVALIFDSSANKIWIGVAGTWRGVVVS